MGFPVKIIFDVASNPEVPQTVKEKYTENIVPQQVEHPLVEAVETIFSGSVVRTENIPPESEK